MVLFLVFTFITKKEIIQYKRIFEVVAILCERDHARIMAPAAQRDSQLTDDDVVCRELFLASFFLREWKGERRV